MKGDLDEVGGNVEVLQGMCELLVSRPEVRALARPRGALPHCKKSQISTPGTHEHPGK